MKMRILLLMFILISIFSCSKDDINPIGIESDVDVFTLSEHSISNADEVKFNLKKDDVYVLKLIDVQTGQVVSKERIVGVVGLNTIKIYTNILPTKNVFLILEDSNKIELGKVKLNIK